MHIFFSPTFLSLMIIYLSSSISPLEALETCPNFSCSNNNNNPIRFPFRVPRNQSSRCGYPGFDLSCHNDQTTLKLPLNSPHDPFKVEAISYPYQVLWISDPNGCIPRRVLEGDLDLTGSPFGWGPDTAEFSFLNCSDHGPGSGTAVIKCMSGGNYTVVATTEKGLVGGSECVLIKRVVAPVWWLVPFGSGHRFGSGSGSGSEHFFSDDVDERFIQLSWDIPECRKCVIRGGSCGYVDDILGRTVRCVDSGGNGGLSLGVKYGLILGAGIPGLVCMVGLTFYISGRVRAYNHQRSGRHVSSEVSPAIYPHPIILTLGLDGPTIESYPKTVLGESRRLPKPSDGTCPICLAEYEPKETLRSIPECNHYFHAECIDEWLRMNATCPLCRNSPNNNKPPS